MNILKLLVFPVFFTLSIFACGDDDNNPDPSENPNPNDTTMMDTSKICLHLFDENGSSIGLYGDCDSIEQIIQWENNPSLTEAQKGLFDFADTSQISGTDVPDISGFLVYPNPVPDSRIFNIFLIAFSHSTVKVKLVFTDLEDTPIREMALPMPANGTIQLLLDEADFPFGEAYHLYYQILANEDSEVIYEGYGNMVTCDAFPVIDIEMECF